jgi:hypothetical protein
MNEARVFRILTKAPSIVNQAMRALGAAMSRFATPIARTPVRGAITALARSKPLCWLLRPSKNADARTDDPSSQHRAKHR